MVSEKLLENRETIELNFIASLYKDISLCDEYKNIINGTDIITDIGKIYYGIITNMYKLGYESADEVSVKNYLDSKPSIKKQYKQYGDLRQNVNVDNIEAYYDELIKSNFLIKLDSVGFNVVDSLDKFSGMTSEEVYNYYEYQLSDISSTGIQKLDIENLSDGYDAWLTRTEDKQNIGFKIGSALLDFTLSGVHKSNLMLYIAGMGQGKSSSAIPMFILPAIEEGEDVTIICNEQDSDQFRNMIISSVLFSKITDDTGLTRAKIIKGSYTEQQRVKIKEAIAWIKAQQGEIHFVEIDSYDITHVKKIIRKQSKKGCKMFFFDVLKNMRDSNDRAWAELSDTAKELFFISKKEKVAIIASAQLSPDAFRKKYLDLTCIGKSKAIAECASCVLGFRHLTDIEKENIKPYVMMNGKLKYIDLDPNKTYIVIFLMKNRFGTTETQIIIEFNQSQNTIRDVGFYKMPYEDEIKKI